MHGAQDQFAANNFAGGGGGGGFMAQQNMQVDGASQGEAKGKGDRKQQSLIPVTIKQLKNAPANASGEQGYTLDGRELNQITICGLIVSADEQSTNLMYNIDDVRHRGAFNHAAHPPHRVPPRRIPPRRMPHIRGMARPNSIEPIVHKYTNTRKTNIVRTTRRSGERKQFFSLEMNERETSFFLWS